MPGTVILEAFPWRGSAFWGAGMGRGWGSMLQVGAVEEAGPEQTTHCSEDS